MFVGAEMPREKTAFASEEPRVRAAAKDTRAAPSKMNTRMGFPPKSLLSVWGCCPKLKNRSTSIGCQALKPNAPSSELLWFINLRMFGIFQRSHAVLSAFVPIDGFQFFGLALPIFVLACFGLVAKSRLSFTVATHLSAAYALFLVISWQVGAPTVTQASLVPIAVPSGVGLYVMATILGTCLLSFAITHLLYLSAVREEIRALVSWPRPLRAEWTGLRKYKIRNKLIRCLAALVVLYTALTGDWAELKWAALFAALMFAVSVLQPGLDGRRGHKEPAPQI
jgi:hypothetical protein